MRLGGLQVTYEYCDSFHPGGADVSCCGTDLCNMAAGVHVTETFALLCVAITAITLFTL